MVVAPSLDFAGCPGSRAAALAASQVKVVRATGYNHLDWALRKSSAQEANQTQPPLFRMRWGSSRQL